METTAEQKRLTLAGTAHHPLVPGLAEAAKSGQFADIKLVCGDWRQKSSSVFWSHRLLLASVSPFLKDVLLSADLREEAVLTLHLPNILPAHLSLVMDYLYTGTMYLTPSDLTGVLRVIEVLRMKCGVSVSKMVQNCSLVSPAATETSMNDDDDGWVEEAKFGGLDQLPIKQEIEDNDEDLNDEEEEDVLASSGMWQHGVFLGSSNKPVEVVPVTDTDKRRIERRMSQAVQEYISVEVIEESDSDEDDDGQDISDDKGNNSAAAEGEKGTHFSCMMCGKQFSHEDNLKTHIRGHLGVDAQLNSCLICKRNFRSSLEHELHANSHRYSQFRQLRRHASKNKERHRQDGLRQKLLKKSIRRIWKRDKNALLQTTKTRIAPASKTARPTASKSSEERRSSRTVRKSAKMAEAAISPKRASHSRKKIDLPPPPPSDPFKLTMKVKFELPSLAPVPPPKKAAPKRRRPSTSNAIASPNKRSKKCSAEDDLTCPTCDKTFPAKSIFERHLKTYRHGIFDLARSAPPPTYLPHAGEPPLPHFNKVLQPTIEVGGREVNKYECHLCNKIFIRVKDLAKHREKTCLAWSTASK